MQAGSRAHLSETDGRLIYAVGDVHGRLDALNSLLTAIAADLSQSALSGKAVLLFLGDYVDRGSWSRGVIDALISLKAAQEIEVVTLLGNHEQTLLSFLEDASVGPTWVGYGGGATLASYGVDAPPVGAPLDDWEETQALFAGALPPEHLAFFHNLELIRVIGDFAFVHAGVRPGAPLSEQTPQDLLWIRDDFTQSHARHEKVVVHGHTPTEAPYDGATRIGVDTGAYATGVLSAVRLMGSSRRFLTTTLKDLTSASRERPSYASSLGDH
ncbi:MAG: metallophosphoesterase family protein [Caulobacteraceae bacterium]